MYSKANNLLSHWKRKLSYYFSPVRLLYSKYWTIVYWQTLAEIMYFNNSMFPILNSSFIVGQSLFGWWTSPGIIKIWLKRKETNISSDKVINRSRRSLALSFATTCLGLIYLGYLFWYLFYLFGLAISANKIAPQTINIYKPRKFTSPEN